MRTWKIIIVFSFIFSGLCGFFLFSACANTKKDTAFDNAPYFNALQAKEANNTEESFTLFKQGILTCSPLCKELCFEELLSSSFTDDNEELLSIALLYLQFFPNKENPWSYTAEYLYKTKQYEQVIELTPSAVNETTTFNNWFYCYQLLAKIQQSVLSSTIQDTLKLFNDEIINWFSCNTLSEAHIFFYNECKTIKNTSSEESLLIMPNLLEARVTFHRRNYDLAVPYYDQTLTNSIVLPAAFYSEYGKCLIYSHLNPLESAQYFDSLTSDNPLSLFYLRFYTGRLYQNSGNPYYSKAFDHFTAAMSCAPLDENYDNALWYLLSLSLKQSTSSALNTLSRYASTWHDSEYFSDFLELLSRTFLSKKLYNEFYRVYRIIDAYATDDIRAQYAYISARLIQEGLLFKSEDSKSNEVLIKTMMEEAWNKDSTLYYKLLSSKYLNKTFNDFISPETSASTADLSTDSTQQMDFTEVNQIFKGYIEYAISDYIYPFFCDYSTYLSTDDTLKAIEVLQNNQEYEQALRLAVECGKAKKLNSLGLLKTQLWPRFYSSLVSENAKSYSLDEYLLYGVIRSESFFNATVVSHADAFGLMQLVESTAGDIARKLKVQSANLNDPNTNILFGSFYLSELISRLDGNVFAAVLSYNTGISRIRSWLKETTLPNDLFLEAVPYEETRGYGIKVFTAAAIYAALYYNKPLESVVAEFGY